jgi:hypothetical protein
LKQALSVLGLLSLQVCPATVSAQSTTPSEPGQWTNEFALAGANALAGGVTAAVTAWIRRQDSAPAFLKGSVGGAIGYTGKRVAVQRFDGAGLLGRQVGAVGHSIVANGGAGRDWFSEVWLAAGPIWFQVSPASERRARFNVNDVVTAFWAISRAELEFDPGSSASTGAVVFRAADHQFSAPHGGAAVGKAIGSVVLVGSTNRPADVISHEVVHVIQHDLVLHAWSEPIEGWAWRRFTGMRPPINAGLAFLVVNWRNRFYDLLEAEARALVP